ncbi:M48 family metallopeptidase [Acinetobacter sp. Marseille-Q1618]|uniref:tetratricopeptide repeat protein n=1 Tax=Acinetobacter sp. Marseille-Q1618 TaxID=2697502 RepID=UPI00156FFC30|nr:hypothetical protein [Acinetobacter sp. Marseille-Q1618]
MQKLSMDKNYINYMKFFVIGDLDQAEFFLKKSLENIYDDDDTISMLLQRLGSLVYLKGDEKQAFELYDSSITLTKKSLISLLLYAKFLCYESKKYHSAIDICDSIIEITLSDNYPKTEMEIRKDYYLNEAKKIKKECEQAFKNDSQPNPDASPEK